MHYVAQNDPERAKIGKFLWPDDYKDAWPMFKRQYKLAFDDILPSPSVWRQAIEKAIVNIKSNRKN